MKRYNVVVGGGISGICTALFLADKKKPVILVEKGSSLGGLLNSSFPFKNEFHFDYGTHFLNKTGNSHLDKLLFDGLDLNQYKYLKVGSFYKTLFQGNGFVTDFHLLNKEKYFNQINTHSPKLREENLNDQLINKFGEGYTRDLFDPILMKFFGYKSKDLKRDAHRLFGLSRIISSNKQKVEKLKSSSKVHDEVLAYHSYRQGTSSLKPIYPKNGGSGSWINYLVNKLNQKNVIIKVNSSVKNINKSNEKLHSIKINNNEFLIENLYWTAPSIFLYPFFKLKEKKSIPRLRSYIAHLVIDSNYLTNLYYYQCFDPNFKTFRVTLYDNFSSPCHPQLRRLTVEVLLKDNEEIDSDLNQKLLDELILMGVVSKKTNLIHQSNLTIPNSFPVLRNNLKESQSLEQKLVNEFSNLHFFGKAYSKKWFMNEVIEEIYKHFYD